MVIQKAAPLLVPLIENDGIKYIDPVLDDYIAELAKENVDTVLLGCTHYALIKDKVRQKIGTTIVSPDEIVPEKLADYLLRHPEIEEHLGRGGRVRYCVTDCTPEYASFAERLVGRQLPLEKVAL
jgi:glutamate racemase